MVYETSYDTGLRPFKHDKNRGKWSSPKDFFFACLGHAFKPDAIFIYPWVVLRYNGIYAVIPYLATLCLCVIPIVFMQSFLGQFSSTGFISVFRISPLFKGIGYVSLIVNLTSLAYYAVLGAIPLFYFIHTLTPTIPWSCEGAITWMKLEENASSICAYVKVNLTNATCIDDVEIPSVEFFNFELDTMTMYHNNHPKARFSWALMICTFIIWAMVATILIKPIEWIGKFLRYSCIAFLTTMGLVLIRLLFLPGAAKGYQEIEPVQSYLQTLFYVPLLAFTALGPGWGSVLTMASYNKFNTNIFRYSWVMCFGQMGVMFGLALMSLFITSFMMKDAPTEITFKYIHTQWMEFLTIPTGLTYMELPYIWSFLFFAMITLGCLNLLIVQLLSVLTSLFDEFEMLRHLKKEITMATVGILALTSILFCTNYGITSFETLSLFSIISQMVLNLLLLIIVVWIYGRERFQRDVSFMTNQTYPTWMINVVRYVAPFFLFLASVIPLGFIDIHFYMLRGMIFVFLILAISLLPFLIIPSYCIFKMIQTTGFLGSRILRSIRPTDWYPEDPDDRRRYEEQFNETEISHNLTTDNVELN
ncbi:sodium-dependent proline transporter-like [Episyrphus balteatus]|uniref:sodium-dependent proline transporter-like n=1 Tax=Episyrphus balteatus TaxID=286459 RepID=UPI0024865EE4|nr:sodium-dependent proline transporter-like [Episyrphus balteatus]